MASGKGLNWKDQFKNKGSDAVDMFGDDDHSAQRRSAVSQSVSQSVSRVTN